VRNKDTRFFANEKLSLQLNLPRKDSDSSDNDSPKEAFLKEEKAHKIDPVVVLLRKNSNNGREWREDSRFYLAERELESPRMEIKESTHSFPMVPSLPSRQSIYQLPKEESHVR
jgi:hypothetical protein